MSAYQDTLDDIKETMGIVPGFMKALPEDVLVNDWGLMKKYQFGESVIPAKYREMIGLAIAANLKCPYCQAMHLNMAKGYGATEEELSELSFMASFTSRWSAMIHAQNYDLDKFTEESGKIGEHLGKKEKLVQTLL
ncbi:MAG: carboxymuconolactone decarboxylase family protein [Methanomassiliicoccus sp.]|nr:carboxymuconolactone decarboxylase family protein [Methanomassiliicoccus sp.]